MSPYFLETERLKIRELTENDALPLFEILSDPDTMRFYPKPFDLESQFLIGESRNLVSTGLTMDS